MQYKIYSLIDPVTFDIRYIGLTGKDFDKRLREHLSEKRSNLHKRNWIQKLKKLGLTPKIELIEGGLSAEEAKEKEIMYIKLYRSRGCNLLNISLGGDLIMAGRKHKESTLKLISESQSGNKNGFYNKKHSDETKAKMSKLKAGIPSWNKGKTLTEDHRKKLALAKVGYMPFGADVRRVDYEEIRKKKSEGLRNFQIAEMFGIDASHVSRIVNSRR